MVVRCRPLNSTERADGRDTIVQMDAKMGSVSVHAPGSSEPPKAFTFDMVFDERSQQADLYQKTAMPIVDSVLDGFNGTIFAYGQTGTGKTFSMEGVNEPPELRGIIPRAFTQIFDRISSRAGDSTEFLVRASYLEIYNEEARSAKPPSYPSLPPAPTITIATAAVAAAAAARPPPPPSRTGARPPRAERAKQARAQGGPGATDLQDTSCCVLTRPALCPHIPRLQPLFPLALPL